MIQSATGQVHRFRDSVGAYLGTGATMYMLPSEARAYARAMIKAADSIEREPFGKSGGNTAEFSFTDAKALTFERDQDGHARPLYLASHFSAQWPPASGGRYRVALYKGLFGVSPVVYRQHSYSDHRTLKAAARRLAHLIHRQSRSGFTGERYDCLYIITPEGERIALREAQARIARHA